jgi:hypothetical protein
MKPQIPLEQMLRIWVSSPNATVAARILGISRRMLYYRVEHASLAELRQAYAQIQVKAEGQLAALRTEAMRSLLATEARVTDLTRQVDTLCREKDAMERERAALARENEALRRELLQCLKAQIHQQMSTGNRTDAPYTCLHVTPNAPPEVTEAAYRALAKIHHPDVGGSDAVMKRINVARAAILERNGHAR